MSLIKKDIKLIKNTRLNFFYWATKISLVMALRWWQLNIIELRSRTLLRFRFSWSGRFESPFSSLFGLFLYLKKCTRHLVLKVQLNYIIVYCPENKKINVKFKKIFFLKGVLLTFPLMYKNKIKKNLLT